MAASLVTTAVLLPDIVVRQILLRLPPEPWRLPRAALVCKRWRNIVREAHFRRQYRARHSGRRAPVLGVFYNDDVPAAPACRFITSGCARDLALSPAGGLDRPRLLPWPRCPARRQVLPSRLGPRLR
ncbi:hypothetical protein PR202_ga08071 [Eleusine coracana subsp. coracana]|uniref:F-box domain-containing protein n=1 Tax=Eleusine coracana subsp. coracana TaxID=191504 RepID=A0AAV5BZM7_ELECO|nr:hypothetical protein PR202_ga08071 [Eleusine coracana subsp. coracana]